MENTMEIRNLGDNRRSSRSRNTLSHGVREMTQITEVAGKKSSDKGKNMGNRKLGRPISNRRSEVVRVTFDLRKELAENLQALAYWERTTKREIIENCLAELFDNKQIKPIPK